MNPHPGHGADPVSHYGLRAVFTILGVVGLCWTGAQLGALLVSHQPAPISLPDAGLALVELPEHLAEPAAAWPAPARRFLPGPVEYWTATLLVCLGASAVTVPIVLRARGRRNLEQRVARRAPSGFARRVELRELTVAAPTRGRLTLGTVRSRLVAAETQTSLAVVGPTGCGKTAGFAIPALREWEGPVIATSVKTDLLDASIAARQARGRVWIYDPTHCGDRKSASWSPLSACRTWAGAMRVSAWLCEAAQPRTDSVSDGDYWYSQARKALAPYLYAAAVSDRAMRDVVRWIDRQERVEVEAALRSHSGFDTALFELLEKPAAQARRDELRKELEDEEMELEREAANRAGGGQDVQWAAQSFAQWPRAAQARLQKRVRASTEQQLAEEFGAQVVVADDSALDALVAAQSLWGKEARLRGSVFATVENVVAGYADPQVARAADAADGSINLAEWLSGDNTIFVVATAHEQARLRPVLTVLVQQAIRHAYEQANNHQGTLPRPCLVLLDEAGNIAPLQDLPTYASTARSHGITLVTIWQDLSQLRAIYGDRARTLLNNHRAKLFGAGIADEATLEYMSRLVGDERRTELNVSGDLHGPRRTVSEHTTYRRAAPLDALRRLPRDEAILLYGNLAPIHLRLRPWYRANRRRRRLLGVASRGSVRA
ncbi:MAG: type IV secretory system conjugative DNA transfer family protein [Acidimicrobiia bacterium]